LAHYGRATVERKRQNRKRQKQKSQTGYFLAGLRKYSVLEKNEKFVPQTIEEYFGREVKPHIPEAWIDHSKTKIGYEINFTKYFYEFKPLRSVEEIKADILALEETTLDTAKTILK
jgi:type I restriction enzyme M protein